MKRISLSWLFTETDAPYLPPDDEERNVPQKVPMVYEWDHMAEESLR